MKRWRVLLSYRASGMVHHTSIWCDSPVDGERSARTEIASLTGDPNPKLLRMCAANFPTIER